MKLLTVQDIEIIHMMIIDATGGSQGTHDVERLKGIVEQMEQSVFGVDLHPSIYDKSASLMFGIIAYHPFYDGNKRTGTMSAVHQLNLNGVDTSSLQDDEFENFAVKVAVDHLEVAGIAQWLKDHSA